jgi:predicted GNAT superfamily acetyltransferase
LNFAKLGVIADRYYVDYYGMTSSFLHRYGTDRLWVTWLLESERVEARLRQEPVTEVSGGVVIEIPTEITSDHEYWRLKTREAFTSALEKGHVVEEFYVSAGVGRYVLNRG